MEEEFCFSHRLPFMAAFSGRQPSSSFSLEPLKTLRLQYSGRPGALRLDAPTQLAREAGPTFRLR